MTKPTEPVTPPLRTWRPMAAWTAGILLVLGVVWFVAAVVVPVWQVRQVVLSTDDRSSGRYNGERFRGGLWAPIQRLGGPAGFSRKLRLYMQLPHFMAPNQEWAASLLSLSERLEAINCKDENTCDWVYLASLAPETWDEIVEKSLESVRGSEAGK